MYLRWQWTNSLANHQWRALCYFRSNQTPPRRTSTPQTSAHAPLFVNPFTAWRRPGYIPFRRNQRMFIAPKYQTDACALSWYKLVTYLGVGRCVIYTALGPSALSCVNHAASYTSVCNLYLDNNFVKFNIPVWQVCTFLTALFTEKSQYSAAETK